MKVFLFAASALGLLTFGYCKARAEDESSAPRPVIVASFAGYAELKRDMDYLGGLSGHADMATGLTRLLLPLAKQQPLAGINQERRWGATLTFADHGFQSSVVAFLPLDDFSKLLDAFAAHGGAHDVGDEIYKIEHDAGAFFIARKDKWAFVARRQSDLEELPLEPLGQFRGQDEKYVAALRVNLQDVPRHVRDLAAFFVKQALAGGARQRQGARQNEPDDRAPPGRVEELFKLCSGLDSLFVGLNLDRVRGRARLETKLSALPGSDAARSLAARFQPGEASRLAGVFLPGALCSFHMNSPLARRGDERSAASFASLSALFSAGIDAIEEMSEEQKAKFKEAVGKLLEAIADNIAKQGRINAGMVVTGPRSAGEFSDFIEQAMMESLPGNYASETIIGPGRITTVVGCLVKDGKALESAAKQLAAALEANSAPRLNLDEYQGRRFHALSVYVTPPRLRQVHASANVEKFKTVFGNPLEIVLACGEDTFYVAVGEKGVEAIKQVIDKSLQAPAEKLPVVTASLSLAPALKFLASQTRNPADARLAESLRRGGEDRVELTVESAPGGVLFKADGEEAVSKLLAFSLGRAAGLTAPFEPHAAPQSVARQAQGGETRTTTRTTREGGVTTTITHVESGGGRGRSMRRQVITTRRSSGGRQASGARGEAPRKPPDNPARRDEKTAKQPGTMVRTWSSLNGKYKVQARFIEMQGDAVRLQTEDGDVVRIAIDKLSEPDQKLARQLAEELEENPFATNDD